MHPGGGCHGKLEGKLLSRLLTTSWAGTSPEEIPAFVNQPEDSALIELPNSALLFSTDMVPLLGVNLFNAGRIAVLHALSDIYASGGQPRWALVTLLVNREQQLEVSSSNFPRFDRNSNTGGDATSETRPVPARQMVYHGADTQSQLILPVVPQ